jgi:hypothetical protein
MPLLKVIQSKFNQDLRYCMNFDEENNGIFILDRI